MQEHDLKHTNKSSKPLNGCKFPTFLVWKKTKLSSAKRSEPKFLHGVFKDAVCCNYLITPSSPAETGWKTTFDRSCGFLCILKIFSFNFFTAFFKAISYGVVKFR